MSGLYNISSRESWNSCKNGRRKKKEKELEDEFFQDEFDNDEIFLQKDLEKIEEENIVDDTSVNACYYW